MTAPRVLAGVVTGFHGQYVVVACPADAPEHLRTHYLAPQEFRATRAVGQRVELTYVVTPVSGLWTARNA